MFKELKIILDESNTTFSLIKEELTKSRLIESKDFKTCMYI